MGWRCWPVLLASACYSPNAQVGSPCEPGDLASCPPGLVCDPALHTCQHGTTDAAGPGDDASEAGAWLGGYGYRKKITIAPPTQAALADFPVSVLLASDADLSAHALADGSDIVFTADDATTRLPHELVAYSGGTLDAWVETTLPAGAVIYMYFGGPAATAVQTPWSSQFAGVWHMNGTPDVARDSAAGHDVMAPSAAQRPTFVVGIDGVARAFDATDTMQAPDPTDGSLDFGMNSFSYGIWANAGPSLGGFDTPFDKGGSAATVAGYNYELGRNAWTSHLSDGMVVQSPSYGTEAALTGAWHHLVLVIDRTAGTARSFTDAVAVATQPLTVGALDNAQPLTFGRPQAPYVGSLDEVRIYRGALTAEWIATEYANLAARTTFITVGAVETP